MQKAPLFLHRPPSVGVHLLSDPLPERRPAPTTELLATETTSTTKRQASRSHSKKTGLRS